MMSTETTNIRKAQRIALAIWNVTAKAPHVSLCEPNGYHIESDDLCEEAWNIIMRMVDAPGRVAAITGHRVCMEMVERSLS